MLKLFQKLTTVQVKDEDTVYPAYSGANLAYEDKEKTVKQFRVVGK